MKTYVSRLVLLALTTVISPVTVNATRTFDFEEPGYGSPDDSCANRPIPPLFNRPGYGRATSAYVAGPPGCGEGVLGGSFGSDASLTRQTGDTNSEVLQFSWVDLTNDSTWVHVPTAPYAYSIPLFPSPTVDIGAASRISMRITVYGVDATEAENAAGQLEFSLCIRETGRNLPLGNDGGTAGPIEFVGIDTKGVGSDADTPVGGTTISHSSTFAWTTVEWRFIDDGGTIKAEVRVDGGPPVTKPIVPFTGDGILYAPNNRGTLEGLAIRKPPGDTVTKKWFVWIDDIVVDAPYVVDPVTIRKPVLEQATRVTVTDVDPASDEVRLYVDSVLSATATPPYSDPANNTHEFTGLAPLLTGQVVTATQVSGGVESLPSEPVLVSRRACYVIEDFDGPTFDRYSSPDPSGEYRTWYDSSSITWASAERRMLQDSPAMAITDGGWTNGVYAIFPQVFCGSGFYHVEVKMHVVEGTVTNGLMVYEIGVAVPGAHRDPNGVLPPCWIIGRYEGLTPGNDTAQGPQIVKTTTFEAQEGQDILIAFSSDVTSGNWNGNSYNWGSWDGTYVLVDDIVLVPHDCCIACNDIAAVDVIGPLVAGDTMVRVANIGAGADYVTVYVNGARKGQLDTRSEGGGTKLVPITAPLAAGDSVKASQSYPFGDGTEVEGCRPATEVTAGSGVNPGELRLAIAVRETRTGAAIGADGGYTGPIEWISATTIVNGIPLGQAVTSSRVWQTVTFDPARTPIIPGEGGNGVIDGGFARKVVLESLAISPDPGAPDTGPYMLYIDNIASGGIVIATFEDYAAGTPEVFFRKPRYFLNTRDNLMKEPNISVVDGFHGDASAQSLEIGFQFADEAVNRWLRLTTYSLFGIPSPCLPNPTIWSDRPITMRILFAPGSPCDPDYDGDVDLDDFAGFQACFNGPNRPLPNALECVAFDYDGDGDADLVDFARFQSCYNGPSRPPACVP